MNGIKEKSSFLLKLGMSAVVLLFAQHAFAVGTTAGTSVDNLATVAYDVAATPQQVVESAPGVGNSVPGVGNGAITTFVVDNRVDFSLTQVGAANTSVTPGESDAFVEFLLSNDGNSAQDFNMAVTQLASGDGAVNTLVDTDVDMANLRIRVGNGGGAPVLGDLAYGDEIAADTAVTVYVFGDADLVLGLVNGDTANIELSATVAAAGTASTLGADLSDDILNPDTAGLEVVFAEGGALGDGIELNRDGFVVASAGLTVSKVATVVSDPFNSTDFKAIPGAVVEYVITITNGGGADADSVAVTDAIDTDVAFITGFYAGGADLLVLNDGSQIPSCLADAGDGNTDGCALDGQDLTVGNGNLAITVTAGTSLVITYRVSIP